MPPKRASAPAATSSPPLPVSRTRSGGHGLNWAEQADKSAIDLGIPDGLTRGFKEDN